MVRGSLLGGLETGHLGEAEVVASGGGELTSARGGVDPSETLLGAVVVPLLEAGDTIVEDGFEQGGIGLGRPGVVLPSPVELAGVESLVAPANKVTR